MTVEKIDRKVGVLVDQVSAGEIRLPEIQRSYVWKPTQVARLVESLYRGYPSGSLLLWSTAEAPVTRPVAVHPRPVTAGPCAKVADSHVRAGKIDPPPTHPS